MKKLIILLLLIVFGFSISTTSLSENSFDITSEVTYTVSTNRKVEVDHLISITNANTSVEATNYTLSLSAGKPTDVEAYNNKGDLPFSLTSDDGGGSKIRVNFKDSVVGEGNSREFHIKYQEDEVLQKTGDVSEILIPKLVYKDEYKSYLVRLIVPDSLGEPAYISPEPSSQADFSGNKTYYFNESDLNTSGVSATFGAFQLFSLDLTYHLQNPLALATTIQVAVPPDTEYQKVFLDSLSPKPVNMEVDADGNWVASYRLEPRERVDIRLLGSAQIYSSPWRKSEVSKDVLADDLKPDDFWQVDDPGVKALAQELGTPERIYDYVVKNLKYDYTKVGVSAKRLGAIAALENRDSAICTEFTDLFVTLSRAAGIPAREVNGYAYTDNSKLRPLSLVADVLHSWAEYWDKDKEVWVPVDPTWGNTTGGADYFTKLDMKHIAFVNHGASSTKPLSPGSYKLGANPQKDVYVSLETSAPDTTTKPDVILSQKSDLPFSGLYIDAEMKNPGPSAVYDQAVSLNFDGKSQYQRSVNVLLPYETRTLEFAIPYGFLGRKIPKEVEFVANGTSYSFAPDKDRVVKRDIVVVVIFLIVAGTLIIFTYTKLKNENN